MRGMVSDGCIRRRRWGMALGGLRSPYKIPTLRVTRTMHMASKPHHQRLKKRVSRSPITAVDLFCGAGGLTNGLMRAGIKVEAGVDLDLNAKHAYETNNPDAEFQHWDVTKKHYTSIEKLFLDGRIRLLAGCAPCTPFSKLTNAIKDHEDFDLLENFGRFVSRIRPELVTMENVPELKHRGSAVFEKFLRILKKAKYHYDWKIVECPRYGVPQSRRRLVLLASRLGPISIPKGYKSPSEYATVRQTIGHLPPIAPGKTSKKDPLHAAVVLSEMNRKRIRATRKNGGTWKNWSEDLQLDCHKKESGRSYGSIYGRMWWDKPSPTMTTLCTGIGNGRFGHPTHNRSITLREAALFQSFPEHYEFWPPSEKRVNRSAVSRMVGNAVPPRLAKALGKQLMKHVAQHLRKKRKQRRKARAARSSLA